MPAGQKDRRRVVITGIGVVAPNGVGKEDYWKAVRAGKGAVCTVQGYDKSELPVQIAAQVGEFFNPEEVLGRKLARRVDRTAHFAIASAREAFEDSGLDLDKEDRNRIGVILGTAMAGHGLMLQQHCNFQDKGPMKVDVFTATASFGDAPAGRISMELGVHGPSYSVATACSSSLDAIQAAVQDIRTGQTDLMFAGGADAPVFPPIMAAFAVLRALSTRNEDPETVSRPFDKDRDGFVFGEGGGMLVLEELEHARARGARIYAEIAGGAATTDAFHMTAPDPTGAQAVRAIREALADAGARPEEVDYVNAHGTSTPLNDKNETQILKEVLGRRAYEIPVSSTKSMIGHLIGAAGVVELIGALSVLEGEGLVPPTINYQTPDPECDLDYVPNKARAHRVNLFLKNSFGFGGKNSALVIRRYSG
ncbi:MAG: beta-ketoacyl-ACP synthase II [Candidatus Omnitrophica bacterium]|nr:beta-ketoacyl-ACP synthase II [Candidatus Omnitrophota bacterium]